MPSVGGLPWHSRVVASAGQRRHSADASRVLLGAEDPRRHRALDPEFDAVSEALGDLPDSVMVDTIDCRRLHGERLAHVSLNPEAGLTAEAGLTDDAGLQPHRFERCFALIVQGWMDQ